MASPSPRPFLRPWNSSAEPPIDLWSDGSCVCSSLPIPTQGSTWSAGGDVDSGVPAGPAPASHPAYHQGLHLPPDSASSPGSPGSISSQDSGALCGQMAVAEGMGSVNSVPGLQPLCGLSLWLGAALVHSCSIHTCSLRRNWGHVPVPGSVLSKGTQSWTVSGAGARL